MFAQPICRPYKRNIMLLMGIETSCDETAAAIVSSDGNIRSNIILSQLDEHRPYGGVVPEIAARSHLQHLPEIIRSALEEADVEFKDLTGVAATAGPGLIGGVMVGMMAAKSIALVHDIPFAAVHHMEAHALTARLTDTVPFPYLALLISGGHCQFVVVEGPGAYQILGATVDDAIGEAFDKTAALLGLPYPGGPAIEAAARTGSPYAYPLPRPMAGRPNCDFSFSGLKTAVRKLVERLDGDAEDTKVVTDIAASFQCAAADVVGDRTMNAIQHFKTHFPEGSTLVVAGGVAANQTVRNVLQEIADREELRFVAPPVPLCTDNGAMVAWAGIERLQANLDDSLDFAPRPRWPLDELTGARQG